LIAAGVHKFQRQIKPQNKTHLGFVLKIGCFIVEIYGTMHIKQRVQGRFAQAIRTSTLNWNVLFDN